MIWPMESVLKLQAATLAARARTGDVHLGVLVQNGRLDVVRAVPPASGRGRYTVSILRAGLTAAQALEFLNTL
jgi:hypothetical protein